MNVVHLPPRVTPADRQIDDGEAARIALTRYGARPEDIRELESWLPARAFVAVVELAVAHGHALASGRIQK